MFVQVVRGVVADPLATFARLDDWLEHLAPGAEGWLGTTAGVTPERELVSFVRFATAADARRSSDRVEQGLWWAGSVLLFTGDVVFDNYDGVEVLGDGGADGAGAMEVLLGRARQGRDGPGARTARPPRTRASTGSSLSAPSATSPPSTGSAPPLPAAR